MADGFHIEIDLDPETGERLQAAARAAGMEPAEYAASVLRGMTFETDWSIAEARLVEYDRTGESISVEEALAQFDAAIKGGGSATR